MFWNLITEAYMLSQYSLHSLFWEFASIHQMLQKVETTLEYHIDLSQQNLLNIDLIFYFLQNFMFAWFFPTMPTASCCKFIVVLTWDGNSLFCLLLWECNKSLLTNLRSKKSWKVLTYIKGHLLFALHIKMEIC